MRFHQLTHAALLSALLTGCVSEPEAEPPAEANPSSVPSTKEEAAEHRSTGKADLPFDLCEKWGWYDDDECDWFCAQRDPVCHALPLGPEPSGASTRHPIVLAHGFNAGRSGMWSFNGVEEALVEDGHVVYSAEVPAFASVEVRASALGEQIEDVLGFTGAERVNVVAHSMGGLDARYLVASLGHGDRVASVTTISSPHRGSRVADVALRLTPEFADDVVDALATLWSSTYNEVERDADVRSALVALSTEELEAFNASNPDDPGVFYQSWAGVSSVFGVSRHDPWEACEGSMLWHEGQHDVMNSMLVPMGALMSSGSGGAPNDGMSTVESSKWGEFRGCVPADHLDEVGQIGNDGPDRHTGFDHVRFYRNLAFDLAARGH